MLGFVMKVSKSARLITDTTPKIVSTQTTNKPMKHYYTVELHDSIDFRFVG